MVFCYLMSSDISEHIKQNQRGFYSVSETKYLPGRVDQIIVCMFSNRSLSLAGIAMRTKYRLWFSLHCLQTNYLSALSAGYNQVDL